MFVAESLLCPGAREPMAFLLGLVVSRFFRGSHGATKKLGVCSKGVAATNTFGML